MQNKNIIRRWANAFFTLKKSYILPYTYKYGNIGKDSYIQTPAHIDGAKNIFLGDHVHIKGHCTILTVGEGKLFIKKDFDCGIGLTIIASNHHQPIGVRGRTNSDNIYRDIMIEEDVWAGAFVTLLPGTKLGRGCIIGANTVIRGTVIPPYAIVIGNPAKIIGFRYTPEEILIHESLLYKEENRIPISTLKDNYEKYYLNRKNEIHNFKNIFL